MIERVAEDMPDGLLEKMSEDLLGRMQKDMPERKSEDVPGRMLVVFEECKVICLKLCHYVRAYVGTSGRLYSRTSVGIHGTAHVAAHIKTEVGLYVCMSQHVSDFTAGQIPEHMYGCQNTVHNIS